MSPRGRRWRYTKYSSAADLFVVTVYGGFSRWGLVPELSSAAWTGVREVNAEHAAVELRVLERETEFGTVV